MLLLGIDLGTSAIKVSVVDAETQKVLVSARSPEDTESSILSVLPGWAEQSPEQWWVDVEKAIAHVNASGTYDARDIGAIGISYQMHGLVLVDKENKPLRNAIIWCDSRAVDIGNEAFEALGREKTLSSLLNSPGNFTASKLAWVKQQEPAIYGKIAKFMLPGDYIASKLTNYISTSISALSEGIFWDFSKNQLSEEILNHFGFDRSLFPDIKPVFSEHGRLVPSVARSLGLKAGIPVSYKAGDQPNNALSLNVLKPGEVAATAGTSGVIYGVTDQLIYDQQSRVNTFAHVNYSVEQPSLGVLLCINGTGILNRWVKEHFGHGLSYDQMNGLAKSVERGSNGLRILPFGNGAERIFENRLPGAHIRNLDFNLHGRSHVFRASQEGVAFAFRYGLDIMRQNGMDPSVIRAGSANMFLSELFTEIFVDATGVPVQLYQNDGSVGAAIGAGIGVGAYNSAAEAFEGAIPIKTIEPGPTTPYEPLYQEWLGLLNEQLSN
ncbi:xylulokinase [bacterium A37T11]|nr:xylulokinase [bacterium A37T11]